VKIIPSNQTLILASERRPASAPDVRSSSETVLQRVTIVAARPDTTLVYLQADYAPQTAARDVVPQTYDDRTPAKSPSATGGSGNPHGYAPDTTLTAYLSPTEQYARTQRLLTNPNMGPQYIDVHA